MEPEHEGSVVREYYITEDTGWYSEREKWKKLKSFGMIHKRVEKADGTKEEDHRYYICSIGENVEKFEWAADNTPYLNIQIRSGGKTSLTPGFYIWGR